MLRPLILLLQLSFTNVIIPIVPRNTFFSSVAEISIKNSEIRDIETEAFKASQIFALLIKNTSIERIRTGAFSERTLIYNLEISKCNISILEAKAIVAAINNLTVQHSR